MTPVLLPTLPSLLLARHTPFVHRDLSWLQFNERVLAEARAPNNPLLERLKFLAITSTNLDEFFMIRMPSINRSIINARKTDPKSEKKFSRIKSNILEATAKFTARQDETLQSLIAHLNDHGIRIHLKTPPGSEAFETGKGLFQTQILPHLNTPLVYSNSVFHSVENSQLLAFVGSTYVIKIPRFLSLGYVVKSKLSADIHFFFLDDLIATHLPGAFSFSAQPLLLRITRDADVSLDFGSLDPASIPDMIQSSLGKRDRGRITRVQYISGEPMKILQKLPHSLKIAEGQIQPAPKTLLLGALWSVFNSKDIPINEKLKLPPHQPFIPKPFTRRSGLFDRIKSKDYLLHHPYDSFQAYINWIQAACLDPKVEMIEQTIYRMDAVSPLLGALKAAAKLKKIRVLIEARARFDELNNLKIAESLRGAGVEVGFGFGKLKLHAKVALVTRNEGTHYQHYTHLSTGNYNSSTAQTYTDLGLLTSNSEFGLDARHFFDTVWTGKIPTQFKQLVSAPTKLHKILVQLIDQETAAAKRGERARIVAKVNALVDEAIVQKLYEASQAGVKIDLIIRGACSLIPGVRGLSENIQVISLVDRYLEHSRIYYFENSRSLYLSSADWMPRNFFSRLELAFPIVDRRIYEFIESIVLPSYLMDSTKARELSPQGVWKRRTTKGKSFRAQTFFESIANDGYVGTSLTLSREELK